MSETKIEYVTHTVNPIRVKGGKIWKHGYHCTKISPGCAHCYAEGLNIMRGTGLPYDNRKVEFYLDLSVFDKLPKKPCRVFVQSMGDLFHEDIGWNLIYKVFERMLLLNQHTYIALTKRQDRMEKIMPEIWFHLQRNYPDKEFPLPNVIGMVTGENQAMIDLRVPALLRSPFACRGVSIEPMLGPIQLSKSWVDYLVGWETGPEHAPDCTPERGCSGDCPIPVQVATEKLDWCIVGAESGPKRRRCETVWIESAVNQCKEADIPVFVKQLHIGTQVSKDMAEWPKELQLRQRPESGTG